MLQVYYPRLAYVIHLGTFVFSSLTQTQFSRSLRANLRTATTSLSTPQWCRINAAMTCLVTIHAAAVPGNLLVTNSTPADSLHRSPVRTQS